MAVYVFTGKLGGGKTLCTVGRIKEKLQAGCKVATNLDIRLAPMFGPNARDLSIIRLPDKPKIHDMHNIGKGNDSYDESRNGLLALDECGTWFNSRNWNDKDRKPVNDWFLHARKLGWDVILIIQDIKLLDSQARDALAEHTVFCRRLDRLQIPFIGPLYKAITGFRLSGPRIHVAKAVYGTSPTDLVADRWVYRGNELFRCYDTKQLFLDDYDNGVYSLLTPWHLRGRFQSERNSRFYMRLTKIYLKRFTMPLAIGLGLFAGTALGIVSRPLVDTVFVPEPVPLVAEIESEVPMESIDDAVIQIADPEPVEKPITVREQFADYQIVSYVQSDQKSSYMITAGGMVFSDEQLRSEGFIVRGITNCEVQISRSDDYKDVANVFASGCVVRPHDRPALDISQYPSINTESPVSF